MSEKTQLYVGIVIALLTIAILAGVVGKAVAPSDYKPYKKE